MTARDVIAEGDVLRLRSLLVDSVALKLHPTTYAAIERALARLESTLAQPSGEAVAWLYTLTGRSGEVADTAASTSRYNIAAGLSPFGRRGVDYHDEGIVTETPLYTTPPAPLGGLTEGDARRYERLIEVLTAERDELGRRLTAPSTGGLTEDAKWREAVIDQAVVAHIYRKEHDTDPRKCLQDIIAWHCAVALDPRVSEEARRLTAAAPKVAAPQAGERGE